MSMIKGKIQVERKTVTREVEVNPVKKTRLTGELYVQINGERYQVERSQKKNSKEFFETSTPQEETA